MPAEKGVTLITPEFRVSYPKVFKPERNDLNGKDEFSLVALFPKGADLTALKEAAKQAARNKWGDSIPSNLRSPFRDGADKKREDGTLPPGYEAGAIFVNMRCQKRPGVVDENLQDIIDDSVFYGGCYARAQVHVAAYDQKGNKGVAIYLNHVQKVRDGESLGGGRVSAAKAFEAAGAVAGASAAKSGADIFG